MSVRWPAGWGAGHSPCWALTATTCPRIAGRCLSRRRSPGRPGMTAILEKGRSSGATITRGMPAVFVLDAKGVIREKDVRGAALDRAVDALLEEQEAEGTR